MSDCNGLSIIEEEGSQDDQVQYLHNQIQKYMDIYHDHERTMIGLEKHYQNRIKERQEYHQQQLNELETKFALELRQLANTQDENARKIFEEEEQRTAEMLKGEEKQVYEMYAKEMDALIKRLNGLEQIIRERDTTVSDLQLKIQQKEFAIKLKEKLTEEKNNQRKKYLQQEIAIYRQQLTDMQNEWSVEASKSKKIARTMNSLISIIENKQRKTVNLIYQYKNEIEELDRLISSVQNCVDSSNTRK